MKTTADILKSTQSIAIVGLSPDTSRASNEVANYLSPFYRIVGVNPKYNEVTGFPCYPDLDSLPEAVDLVDVFQRSENVMPFVQPAIDLGVKCFWMQLGIRNAEARALLEAAGILVVEDKCTKLEHARFL